MNNSIYIISLAFNQTKFWYEITINNLSTKLNYIIVSFDTESSEFLKRKKVDFVNAEKIIQKSEKIYQIDQLEKKVNLNTQSIKKILNHEFIFFGKRNEKKILKKFLVTCLFFEEYFSQKKNSIFIHEIGGFIPNISTSLFCKKFKFDFYNLETSFYYNHFHILKNTSDCNPEKNNKKEKFNLVEYFNNIKLNKRINIPTKDKLHFSGPFKKFLYLHNIKRFFQKQFRIHFLNYNYVFGHDFLIVRENIKCFFNHLLLKRKYIKLERLEKLNFYYFPLHVPNDFALTMRAFNFVDQLKFIENIAKKFPDIIFAIKEHPARIGSFQYNQMKNLLNQNKNIFLFEPDTNNFEILKKCKGVITINSKSGFEGMLYNKKIITFGESFYKNFKNANFFNNIKNLESLNFQNSSEAELYKDLQNLYGKSFKGSLYSMDKINIDNFSKSLAMYFN